jgi:hypothetical protein
MGATFMKFGRAPTTLITLSTIRKPCSDVGLLRFRLVDPRPQLSR